MTDVEDYMLTTKDNPYDPFKEFSLWESFDEQKGYYTCQYLARIAKTSDDLTESQKQIIINEAIDEIIKYDPLKIYKKVKEK